MRPFSEAGPESPPGLRENGLVQILANVVEEVRVSVRRDVNGADLLYSLLNAPWLQSLLKVYECLQQYIRDSPRPFLPFASGISQEVIAELRAVPSPSPAARELYALLRDSHLQALLSAHDIVAQKDYDPMLPPLPDNLPDDEEAVRIVCLVKNKQPLRSVGGATRSRWDKLRRLTKEKLASGRRAGSLGHVTCGTTACRRSYASPEHLCAPPPTQPRPLPRPLPLYATATATGSSCTMCRQSSAFWEDGLYHSAPSVCGSVLIDLSIGLQLDEGAPYQMSDGATIRRNDVTGEIFIARVIHGGLADRSGLLYAGDRLVEVNGLSVEGLEPEQIIQILARRPHGTIMFKVVPISDRPVNSRTMLYVRAMADYSPQQDPSIPCAEAGMSFHKGDVLEVVDQTDALWWQARKLPSTSGCAGLIPSTSLLKRKQREFWWSQPFQSHTCINILSTVDEEDDMMAIDDKCVETDEETFESEEDEFSSNMEGIYLAGFRRSLRLCRRKSHTSVHQQACYSHCPRTCYSALANPYEEVVHYQRHPEDTHRLIALVGPSGVGVNELRRRLIEINPKTFSGAVPHTTRTQKSYEESGREYHFINKELFENMVYNHRFVEYGEHKGNMYGTSIDAIKEALDSGKICVIDIEPHAIQSVRTQKLKAYVVFVKPPSAARMRQTRRHAQLITEYYVNRPLKEEDFQEMEDAARKMEHQYCQFFDHVMVNDGLQDACVQLLTAIRRAQDQPQWVPACWLRPSDAP